MSCHAVLLLISISSWTIFNRQKIKLEVEFSVVINVAGFFVMSFSLMILQNKRKPVSMGCMSNIYKNEDAVWVRKVNKERKHISGKKEFYIIKSILT